MAQLNFNEQFYLQQNPDVVAAIARGQFANAQAHFNQFGAFEGRDPNAFFDTSFYLSQYPDVLNARANPLDHFINFGAAELRFANANADEAIDTDGSNFANEFDAEAYLDANPDLANAVGAGRAFENAYEHYVLFGQFENRPGTPAGGPFTTSGTAPGTGQNFSLTNAIGEVITGTSANDTISGVLGNGTTGTLNTGDQVNGGAGFDTLNITTVAGAAGLPAGVSISNVERININGDFGAGIDATAFGSAAVEIYQTNASADVTNLGTNQTVGFVGGDGIATVTAAARATSINVVLDDVASGANITFAETTADSLSVVNVTGSVAAPAAGDTLLTLTATAGDDVDTLNLSLDTDTSLTLTNFDDLTAFNASGSEGGITVDLGTPDELASARFGAGDDVVTLSTASIAAATSSVTVDLGAGNDTFVFTGGNTAAATTISITLGAGADTLDINGLTNITDQSNFASDLITVTDFSAGEDLLDLAGLGTRETFLNPQLQQIAAATSLEAAVDLVAQFASNTATNYAIFDFDGDAYVFVNGATAGDALANGDGLLRLTGVSVGDLNAQNFIA